MSPRAPSAGPRASDLRAPHVRAALAALADEARAAGMARFFKTGPGEYGEGDVFLGIPVPALHQVAKRFRVLPLIEIGKLLHSKLHEERATALDILALQCARASEAEHEARADFYLANTRWVNNWDLVDASARPVLGAWLLDRDRRVLDRLARSDVMWERRIAIIATFAFIMNGESKDTFRLAARLLGDEHDLMHKAVGWMLREVGKRVDEDALRGFLEEHSPRMPRTALRYAIERFPPAERKAWLARPRAT